MLNPRADNIAEFLKGLLDGFVTSKVNLFAKLLPVVLEKLLVHVIPIIIEGIEARLPLVSMMHMTARRCAAYLVQELFNCFAFTFRRRAFVPHLSDVDDFP